MFRRNFWAIRTHWLYIFQQQILPIQTYKTQEFSNRESMPRNSLFSWVFMDSWRAQFHEIFSFKFYHSKHVGYVHCYYQFHQIANSFYDKGTTVTTTKVLTRSQWSNRYCAKSFFISTAGIPRSSWTVTHFSSKIASIEKYLKF